MEDGKIITQGYNLKFGQIRDTNSYRAEIYASLVATLFLHVHSQFVMVKLENNYIAICDNQAYVNKIAWLLEDYYHLHGLHKATEYEALLLILQILPSHFYIEHIRGRQDDE